MSMHNNPLIAPSPQEIPLRQAPLVRVIAQVRFPVIASIEKRDYIAPFQEVLRPTYPVLRPEKAQALLVGPQGVMSTQPQVVWRFNDIQGSWRVSLAPDFIALETTSYASRNDFLQKLHMVLCALNKFIGPQTVDRLGLRYIDRVTGQAMQDITQLVRPEVSGILATPMATMVQQSLSASLFEIQELQARMLARWGQIPPQSTVDPDAIEPVSEPSWILDLDIFSVETLLFDPVELGAVAGRYAERLYTLFRWVVTDEFLRRYGGEL